MIRLNYSKVAFMGDCKSLFDELNQFKTEQTIRTSVSQRLPLCYRISLRSQDIEITLFITYLDIILML
ncbi:unnamed protein product [Brassica oleracea]